MNIIIKLKKANIEINEEGVIASAATAVINTKSLAMRIEKEYNFIID